MPDLDSNVGIPSGGITQWSGLLINIPRGHKLCDGQNGRPDLRNRFIRGAPAGTDPGSTGGSDTIVLIQGELPIHNHGVSQIAHTHTTPTGNNLGGMSYNNNFPFNTVDMQSATSGISLNNTGLGFSHENRPAYYQLAYIIKE